MSAYERLPLRLMTSTALASALSGATMTWRSRLDTGHWAAATNAVSHWIWGNRALRRNSVTTRETGVGAGVHTASALLWAVLFEALRLRHKTPTVATAVADAAIVTAVAATVDLKLVPHRLTPGFQDRLSNRSLLWTYAAFAAGLALGSALVARR